MSSKKLVLVTGASGFIGAQAVEYLLNAGYAVRGTSRSNKAEELRKSSSSPDFDVAIVEDLCEGDFSDALKGVHAIAHIASPMPHKDVDSVKVAVDATMNVLRQAYAKKIYKWIVLGSALGTVDSLADLFDPSRTITPTDWLKMTYDEAHAPGVDRVVAYSAGKALAERAAWEFAESHPEVDLTTLLPMFVYGPLAAGQVVHDPRMTLSTNGWLYLLIAGPGAQYPQTAPPQYVDVRDVARSFVSALAAGPAPAGERKRIFLVGGSYQFTEAVRHLGQVRPALKTRMVDGGVPPGEVTVAKAANFDVSKARDILGIKEWIDWRKTVEDAIDSILKREPSWM